MALSFDVCLVRADGSQNSVDGYNWNTIEHFWNYFNTSEWKKQEGKFVSSFSFCYITI